MKTRLNNIIQIRNYLDKCWTSKDDYFDFLKVDMTHDSVQNVLVKALDGLVVMR